MLQRGREREGGRVLEGSWKRRTKSFSDEESIVMKEKEKSYKEKESVTVRRRKVRKLCHCQGESERHCKRGEEHTMT